MDITMTVTRLWVLGASDPEMAEIESVLLARGERVVHAVDSCGGEVTPRTAYEAYLPADACASADIHTVECALVGVLATASYDHHRPGDSGYGLPPESYWVASSIGQVIEALGGAWLTDRRRVIAAADHCLVAAYAGQCPGVRAEDVRRYRTQIRSAYQGITEGELSARIETAVRALRAAPELCLLSAEDRAHAYDEDGRYGCDDCNRDRLWVSDMRGAPVPELVEAAMTLGVAYMAGPFDSAAPVTGAAERKYVVSGPPEVVRAWLRWAAVQGMHGAYGDPERGFAGAYSPAAS